MNKYITRAEFLAAQLYQKYFLRLTAQEKIIFAKRLGVLINAGIPILSALKMMEKQAMSKSSLYIFKSLAETVENGESLSKSMRKFQKVFGEFPINIVHVGELSGNLQQNLNYMAEELKKQQELKRKIISALVYPAFIVVATLGMVILLMAYVFPKIMPVFKSFHVPLPWTTKSLIFLSNLLIDHGFLIFTVFVGTIVALAFIFKRPRMKNLLHRKILYVPFIGSLLKTYCMANFTRTLGLLIKSDIKITPALNIIAATTSNLSYKFQFSILAKNVGNGERLANNLQRAENFFPILIWQMVEVGEATGNLSESLVYLSQIYEDELNNLTKNLSTSIEPLLMIFMGLLVGFIAVSIITPIYGITQNLHQ